MTMNKIRENIVLSVIVAVIIAIQFQTLPEHLYRTELSRNVCEREREQTEKKDINQIVTLFICTMKQPPNC